MKQALSPIVDNARLQELLQLEPVTGTHEERRAADERNAARVSAEVARANRQIESFIELD